MTLLFVRENRGPRSAPVSRIYARGNKLGDEKERREQWIGADNGTDGDGAESRREEMSHITAVSRVLVKILLEQLHSNTVCFR